MSIFNRPLMGDPAMSPQQGDILRQLKDEWDQAVRDGDIQRANSIKRQKKMFMQEPEAFAQDYSPSPAEDFTAEFAESVRNYWRGFDPTGALGEQSFQDPQSGAGWAGNILGSIAAQPFDVGRKTIPLAAQAAAEGYTAPARSEEERRANALIGAGASVGLRGVGGAANRLFDLGAGNKQLPEALDYAKREGLPAPFIDDYSRNPIANVAGWMVDEPMVVGRFSQAGRAKKLEDHARWQAESRNATRGLDEGIKRQHEADWMTTNMQYADLFEAYPQQINDELLMQTLDTVQGQMQRVKHLLPKNIQNKVAALVETPPTNLSGWHELRSILRETTESMKKGGKVGRRYLTQAVDSIDDMMYKSLDDKGKLMLRRADQQYAETIPKYREMTVLSKAISDGDADGVLNFLTSPSTTRHTGEKVWRSLDEDGKADALALIHQRATQASVDAAGNVNPAAYGKFWRDFGEKADFLPPKEREAIKGLEALYGMSRTAADEGSQWIQSRGMGNALAMAGMTGMAGLGTAGLFTPQDMMMGLTGVGAVAGLMRTPLGNKFLRGIGKAQSAAEVAKLTTQLQHAIVRNPEMGDAMGFTQQDREKMATTLDLLDRSGQAGWMPLVDQVDQMWSGFNQWAAQKGAEYREEEQRRTQ